MYQKQKIIKFYEAGMTIREISAETGLSYGAVWNVLHRANVKMRPRGVRRAS